MPQRVLNRVMSGERCLDEDAAAQLSPPRPSGDLRQEIERLLRGTEIGIAEDGVGVEDCGESDAGEMMPLAEHLRSDERLCLRGAKAVEDANELALLPRRIAVEDLHRHVRKIADETLSNLFRSESDRLEDLARA